MVFLKIMAQVAFFLPCYNVARFIDECILSLLAQTYKDFIVLAYDDNSEDTTYEHLLFWQETDSRIIVDKPFDSHKGYVPLLDKMLLNVDVKYIFRQDADDISLPKRLEIQLNFMENKQDCILCGTQGKNILDKDGKIFLYPWEDIYVNPIASYETSVNSFLRTHHRIIDGSMCIRSDIMHSLNGYDETLIPIEDWDLTLRASNLGNIYIVPHILYLRRLHLEQTARNHPNKKTAINNIVQNHQLTEYQFKSFRNEFNV